MEKKLFASLLVGSIVISASLVPLSAQAVTTENTPVWMEFGGEALPDGDSATNTVGPNPDAANSGFDLLYIPVNISFDKTAISGDLSSIRSSSYANYGIDDLGGTKKDWYVTATILEVTGGEDKLTGVVSFNQVGYVLYYDGVDSSFETSGTGNSSLVAPEFPATSSITIGSGVTLVGNAVSGKGQGLWNSYMMSQKLSITTSYQQFKAGTYTDNIIRNLVAGPSI